MNSVQRAITIYKTNSQFNQTGSHTMYDLDQKKNQKSLSANETKAAFDKILKEKMKKN